MTAINYLKSHFILFFAILIFSCLPIWYFDFYINQDGSPHLYNSYIILELLKGNSSFSDIYAINPYPIPNLSGHWILSLLLTIFTPYIATKIMVTFTFGGLVGACGWLRWQTSGREGVSLAFLFGAVIAFNWLWFLGFYNFIIGLIGFTFTMGLFWKWRENLTFLRTSILSLLIIFVYFSHLISFGMLFGGFIVILLFSANSNRKKNLIMAVSGFIPSFPLIIGYKLSTESGGAIFPNWRYLKNPFSISDWFLQLQSSDPFQLITRKGFPFLTFDYAFFSIFSVILWLFLLIFLLSIATFFYRRQTNLDLREKLPWLLLVIGSIIFWIFAPDDFGSTHGGILRERVLLCGMICFIPLFELKNIKWLKGLSSLILCCLITFQTLVLWEYSVNTNKIGQTYLLAKSYINDDDKLASIVLIDNSCRYKSSPLSNLNPLLGIGKNTQILDNYEIGYYLFPVVAKHQADREFTYELRQSNAIDVCNPQENVSEKLSDLETLLELQHQRISVLLTWDEDERLNPIIYKWFEVEPYFKNGKVKLRRHK